MNDYGFQYTKLLKKLKQEKKLLRETERHSGPLKLNVSLSYVIFFWQYSAVSMRKVFSISVSMKSLFIREKKNLFIK